MRERDQAVTRSTGGTLRRGPYCDACDAQLAWVRFREITGFFGGWMRCDPNPDVTSGVTPTIAWEIGQVEGRKARVGWVVTPHRPRGQGMRMTTHHDATCSAARRRDVPANERPAGEAEMAGALHLFDPPTQGSTTPIERST